MTPRQIDARLTELGRRTAALGPRPGFQRRVLAAIGAEQESSLWLEIGRGARLFMPVALVLTLVAFGWALQSEDVSAAELAVAEQGLELPW